MDKNKVIEALKKLKEHSKKRNFTQTYDLIVNLKDLNLKDPEQQVDYFVSLHFSRGRKVKVCGLVGPELKDEAKKECGKVITQDDFAQYTSDKKLTKKLSKEFDFFIAQANIMAKVATTFGKVLGPRKKMPNPKAGCVVPPKTSLGPLVAKLQKTVRLFAKEKPLIQCPIGNESMKDEEIIDNFMTVYNSLIHHLPKEENNVKGVFIKLTMSKPIKVE